ncbi:alanyl-tRNA editing protein [Pelosinus sp. sgz500959]|uniref:alanyl-tRNA editing protein n=1 Tax=Pelosinus sp. sgz500959 TaxID=3242472 RepID=UPI003672515F
MKRMNVEKIFWVDPYLTELTAKITSVDGEMITVDQTIAYAFSGGQESDGGTIDKYNIIKAEKRDKQIVYFIDDLHELKIDDQVLMRIDWTRRYKLMKLHFAAELVLELIQQNFNDPMKVGAHIAEDKARVDFVWQGNISQTFDLLNNKIKELVDLDLPIKSAFSDQEKEIRYWEIENFAKVPCGGTHLKKTGELGRVSLKRNNIGKGKERIEIMIS